MTRFSTEEWSGHFWLGRASEIATSPEDAADKFRGG